MNTLYMFESWLETDTVFRAGYHSYESLLEEAIGVGSVLLYIQEEDYQGDWLAVVTDGERLGLVNGSFGSCSGCDMLEDVTSPSDLYEVAEMYLQSVRTFPSWDQLATYIEGLEDRDWNFRFGRASVAELARVGMPLGAVDIFGCLLRDNPGMNPVEAARSAKALH